ncbi:MAG: class I SAM-dependent methyltransferase, partial [Acidobacteria bacterium]|nr:class I SAM-dependent methyltransferase [Acidobacteriota bacterium]
MHLPALMLREVHPTYAPPPPAGGRRAESGRRAAGVPAAGSTVAGYYHRIARYLDLELADRGDAAFWQWAASTPPSCRVLELGAGTGRATAFLAAAGARVLAIDLVPELIAMARLRLRRRADGGGAANGRVELLVADMRQLPLAAEFDLVVAVDDPFAHLLRGADRSRALAQAAAHLAPGGRLILDAAWFSLRRRELASRPEGLAVERFR